MEQTMLDFIQRKFRVNGKDWSGNGVSISQFTDEFVMEQLIKKRTAEFVGTDNRVGGANMMRWLGSLFTAHVYMYTMHNKWLIYDDCHFIEKGKVAEFQLASPKVIEVDEHSQSTFFKERLRMLFESFRPIVTCVTETSGLPIQQVWGLLCNPFYNNYHDWLATSSQKQTLNDHLAIIKDIEPTIFGLKHNPFDVSFQYIEHWRISAKPVHIKTACCMSYLKANGENCYSCPKINRAQRKERKEQLLLKYEVHI